ncbi:LysR substrate-binding domain-containing protein [Inquilinus sp. Marseille-Q2685]|uniref:LysR substrate-binding domain-containing protein n=1 Tax=Inquilinus sp. Marseille-Q2685 TaxID=2866581 RepID=UPI001CE48B09|nr:LysR substrate-binding domain-containing protein [Inquilinus sp. Marseille-Q2685]
MADASPHLPLAALRTFDSVARHLSFTKAAAELAVTQSAVSHQIRSLESDMCVRLFKRLNPGIALTEAGAQLAPEVRAALERLSAAVAYTKRCGRGGVLRVGAGGAFATGWLVPRLGRFAAAHPEIEVRLSMAMRNPDLEEDELDLAVLSREAERPLQPDGEAVLFEERIYPVCSPTLLPLLRSPADLARVTLLHEECDEAPSPRSALSWEAWLERLGVADQPRRSGIRLSHFTLVLAAALGGVGVALGREQLIQTALAEGRLVRPFGPELELRSRRQVIRWRSAPGNESRIAAFRSWLLAESAADR